MSKTDMTMMALASRAELGEGEDRSLDREIALAQIDKFFVAKNGYGDGRDSVGIYQPNGSRCTPGNGGPDALVPYYTSSFSAILPLIPGWAFPLLDWRGAHCRMRNSIGIDFPNYTGLAQRPERALLAATLRLLAHQGRD